MSKNLFKRIVLKTSYTKRIAYFLNGFFYMTLIPIFEITKYIQKTYFFVAFHHNWTLAKKVPTFFKQESNLYTWIFKPQNVHFAISPSLARTYLSNDSIVLDIGCGDGLIDYLFFSDIAKRIDAIDTSIDAIKLAKSKNKNSNINYLCTSFLDFQPNVEEYDYIFWNDSIDYFSLSEINLSFKKIKKMMGVNSKLHIKTPISKVSPITKTNHMKSYVDDYRKFLKFLEQHFMILDYRLTNYQFRNDIDVILSKKDSFRTIS